MLASLSMRRDCTSQSDVACLARSGTMAASCPNYRTHSIGDLMREVKPFSFQLSPVPIAPFVRRRSSFVRLARACVYHVSEQPSPLPEPSPNVLFVQPRFAPELMRTAFWCGLPPLDALPKAGGDHITSGGQTTSTSESRVGRLRSIQACSRLDV